MSITRLARPPKDLDSFLGRKWLESIIGQNEELTTVLNLPFVLILANAGLPNSRTLGVGTSLTLADGGAGNAIVIDLSNTGVSSGTYNSVTVDSKGRVTAGVAVTITNTVSNADGSLTISPTSGAVIASINLSKANIWLADQSVPDEVYGVAWNASVEVPTKNAIYDKIESVLAAAVSLSVANTWLADQSVPDEAYGVGWDGSVEVPTKNAVYDKIESLPVLASGVYTPTRSAEANLDANVTMTEAQYLRVGSTVTVSGRFTADPTTTATITSFEATLPIASNLGAVEDLAGTAFCGAIAGMGAEVIGVVANDTAKVQWISSDVASQSWSYTYSYQII